MTLPSVTFDTGLDARRSYAEALSIRDRATGKGPDAKDAARRFVSQALVEPALKQMRESNDAAPPFAPGPAEKQFGAILDSILADEITKSSRFGLVDRIARQLERTA